MKRQKTFVERSFIRFVMENCGCPDGGTATSYETALHVLNMALSAVKPAYAVKYDVWDIVNPSDIHKLYLEILSEQRRFIKDGTGLFAAVENLPVGKSYYRRRWCSAALRFLERFRSAQNLESEYEHALEKVITNEQDAKKAAKNASKIMLSNKAIFVPDGVSLRSRQGKEIVRKVRIRCNQNVFRRAILKNYHGQCCITGIDVDSVLDAAHIKDWSEDLSNALDVTNGLCLSATFHRAFDAHLMEIGDDYRVMFSEALKDACALSVYNKYFKPYNKRLIQLPSNTACVPSIKFLAAHRKDIII